MNSQMPQSWFDFPVMPTMDIRSLVQTCALEDQGGALLPGSFSRSTTWLSATSWVAPPVVVTPRSAQAPSVICPNSQDYDSVEAANTWNALHAMTATSTQLPLAVEKIMFLKAGAAFVNNLYLDWQSSTSTDVQLSFRDNSVTSGDFQNSGTGTIPVFAFPSSTYCGVTRNLQVTLLQPGRFQVALRLIETSSGNHSLYEMDWIVLP